MLNYHVLEWWAKEDRPNHVFLQFEGSKWTYKQFYLEVQRIGNWLMNDLGIQRDEIVALDGRNSNSYVLLWFGLEAIGACPAFINSNLTSDSLVHCVKVGLTFRILTNPQIANYLPACRFEVPNRRESYRATGGALSRQSRSRECADSILRRQYCRFLPRYNTFARLADRWNPSYRPAPADLHLWHDRLTKSDCHHRRSLDQHCSSHGKLPQSQARRQHVHVPASLPRRGLRPLYCAYHICWRDGEHWKEVFAQDILE